MGMVADSAVDITIGRYNDWPMPTTSESSAGAPDQTSAREPHKGWILALACVAQFMVVLDLAIVNVALPAIRDDFHFSSTGLQWVVNAYTLAFAGFLLLGGRAADLFGQRKIFMLGVALFGAASVVGGLAANSTLLIVARAAQGLGGAVLSPATLTIITTTFTEPRERARAMGLWSALAGAGGTAGAVFGGILTDLVSWRWIFLINVPVAIAALVVAYRLLHVSSVRHSTKLDATGGLLVTAGLVALVYSIVGTEQYGWLSGRTLLTAVVAVVLLTWFALHESKVAKEPIMPLSLWKLRSLASANLVMFMLSSGMFAMWFLLSLELQNVRGYSPLEAGFAFVPLSVGVIAGAQLSSRLVGRVGNRPLVIVACIIAAAGLFLLSIPDVDTPYVLATLIPGALTTFGMGLSITPIVTSAMVDVKPHQAGLASGLINTSRQVGGAIGLAVLSTIAATSAQHAATHATQQSALLTGYSNGLLVASLAMLGALLASFALPPMNRPKLAGNKDDSVEVAIEAAEA